MKDNRPKDKALFISYNGLLEPILTSQALPYIKKLADMGYDFFLLTYEKKSDLRRLGRNFIDKTKKDLAALGIEWRYLRYHKNPRFIATMYDLAVGMLYTLYLILFRRIKIVHVRGITPGSIMITLPRLLGVKVLFDMRGRLAEEMAAGGLWKEGGFIFKLVKMAEKKLLEIADAVTVLTKKHLDLIKDTACLKDRNIPIEVIPCCVDMGKFYYDKNAFLKKELGLEGKFVLAYPGKIGTFYYVDYMLDFFKVMKEIIPNAIFMILTTDDIKPIMDGAGKKGIDEKCIKIFRNVEFDRLPLYFRIADAGIFFINSYNKLGSSPIKMGEFLASGVPVVINPGVGDTEELVINNKTGVVVRDFDKPHYNKAVSELQSLIGEGELLKERCRITASRYLSLEGGAKKYGRIYMALSGKT